MNWYYNKDGQAQGPLDEDAMAALCRDGDLREDSLIWQPALATWQTLRQLSPAWARGEPAPKATTTPVRQPKRQATPPAGETARPHLKPHAPVGDPQTDAPKPGLFKRLFGRKKTS